MEGREGREGGVRRAQGGCHEVGHGDVKHEPVTQWPLDKGGINDARPPLSALLGRPLLQPPLLQGPREGVGERDAGLERVRALKGREISSGVPSQTHRDQSIFTPSSWFSTKCFSEASSEVVQRGMAEKKREDWMFNLVCAVFFFFAPDRVDHFATTP